MTLNVFRESGISRLFWLVLNGAIFINGCGEKFEVRKGEFENYMVNVRVYKDKTEVELYNKDTGEMAIAVDEGNDWVLDSIIDRKVDEDGKMFIDKTILQRAYDSLK